MLYEHITTIGGVRMRQKLLFDLQTCENNKKLSSLDLSFAEYLKNYHSGRLNAVTARNMRQFGSAVEIRSIVHSLRVEGVPICSCADGYYFATTSHEVYQTMKQLKSRIDNIENAYVGIKSYYDSIEEDQ